ncbi:MAG TPA: hypothetical protein DCL41_10120 [Bdellovibrionales bacterium]|nr:hypothetical protein [Bdellovibrionales bacterium]|tara:strand:+ start:5621 stop:6544 length:924 start_codon:yes stop_codon:yes gene_type:complete
MNFPKAYFRVHEEARLLDFLKQNFPTDLAERSFSPKTPLELVPFGAVYVDGQRILEDIKVSPNSLIKVHLVPKRYPLNQCSFKPEIVFENEDFVVADKPSPFPIHPTADNFAENLLKFLEKERKSKLYITSRLDAGTEGLAVFAKNKESQTALNQMMSFKKATVEDHISVKKIYRVFSYAKPPLGRIVHFQTSSSSRKIFSGARISDQDKICILEVLKTHKMGPFYLSEVQLITGRTHQIRGQFAQIGCAIVGDTLYGDPSEDRLGFGLECSRLQWTWKGQDLEISRSAHRMEEWQNRWLSSFSSSL